MVSQASKLLDEAREQAVADARRKAEIYARAAGVTLGAPLSISEGRRARPDAVPQDGGRHGMAASAGGAGRRDASGDGERVVGDQGDAMTGRASAQRISRPRAVIASVSEAIQLVLCAATESRLRSA